jgi:hypothetical protein
MPDLELALRTASAYSGVALPESASVYRFQVMKARLRSKPVRRTISVHVTPSLRHAAIFGAQ